MLHPFLITPQPPPSLKKKRPPPAKKAKNSKSEPRQHVLRHTSDSLRVTYVSITGNRPQNEDSAAFSTEARVFGLFDGWGGKAAGEQASHILPALAVMHQGENHEEATGAVQGILHGLNQHFASQHASQALSGCTAVIAHIVDDCTIAVGLAGDSEAFVMDCLTQSLALPHRTWIHDSAQSPVEPTFFPHDSMIVAAVAPHGLSGLPVYEHAPSYALRFEPNPRLPIPILEMPLTDYPFCRDISLREVQLRAQRRNDGSTPRVHLPHPQQIAPTPRIMQSTEPTRSIGADAQGHWTRMSKEEGIPPLTDPEFYVWEFESLKDKWLVLHCDGLYNNEAFRGPKSVAKFLACPYLFIAQDLLASQNVWVHELCAAGHQAFLHGLNLIGRHIIHAKTERERRQLLAEFLTQVHHHHSALSAAGKAHTGSAGGMSNTLAMEEALQYLSQWALSGNLHGLSFQEADPAETLLALVHLAILMKSDDNISIMTIHLSDVAAQ